MEKRLPTELQALVDEVADLRERATLAITEAQQLAMESAKLRGALRVDPEKVSGEFRSSGS